MGHSSVLQMQCYMERHSRRGIRSDPSNALCISSSASWLAANNNVVKWPKCQQLNENKNAVPKMINQLQVS